MKWNAIIVTLIIIIVDFSNKVDGWPYCKIQETVRVHVKTYTVEIGWFLWISRNETCNFNAHLKWQLWTIWKEFHFRYYATFREKMVSEKKWNVAFVVRLFLHFVLIKKSQTLFVLLLYTLFSRTSNILMSEMELHFSSTLIYKSPLS